MARLARVVIPGRPHHVTQRGNRRQQTFFEDLDYEAYRRGMAEWCGRRGVEIWAYCLMPNHVHLVAVPKTPDALARTIGEAHRRYTVRINRRNDWRGFLWQGRFGSCVLDRRHLLAAVRYIERNPVRAGLVERPEAYPWSSAAAHMAGRDDVLVRVRPMLDLVGDWGEYLAEPVDERMVSKLRRHSLTGRPLGSDRFIASLEAELGRRLRKAKPGPKPPSKGS